MEEAQRTPMDVARHLGITDSAVHQWITKDSGPRRARIPALASYLNVSTEWLMQGTESSPPAATGMRETSDLNQRLALPPLVLWRVIQLASSQRGEWMLKRDRLGEIQRPDQMRFARRGFAVEVVDTRNNPVYRPRDTLLINPDREVLLNDDCLLTGNPEAPTGAESIVGCLVQATPTEWTLKQYGTRSEHKFTRADYPHAWFVHGVIRS